MTLNSATTVSSELPRFSEEFGGISCRMRKVLQARGDPCRVPVLLLFNSLFIAVFGFSLWRGVADT